MDGDSTIAEEVAENKRDYALHSTLTKSFNENFPPNQEQLHKANKEDDMVKLKGEIMFLKIELKKKQVSIDQKNIAINMKIVEVERLKMEQQKYEKEVLKMKNEVKSVMESIKCVENDKQVLEKKVTSLEKDKTNYSACIQGLRKEIKEAKSTSGLYTSNECQKKNRGAKTTAQKMPRGQ